MLHKTILLIAFFLLSAFGYAQDQMNNNTILNLLELGFGTEIIKAKIEAASETNFVTHIDALQQLKARGVSSEILALMIKKSALTIQTGVFYKTDKSLVKIQPTVFSGTKTNALGAALSFGIAPVKTKSYVNAARSTNVLNTSNPVFVFQFDNAKQNDLGSGNWWFRAASSPSEFVLTTLTQKKDSRELVTGKMTGITASAQMGIDSKKTIKLLIKDLGKGKYEVTTKMPLAKGEYCFFYQGTIPVGGFNNQSIFDFSIR